MRKLTIVTLIAAVSITGCGLIDSIENQISNIKNTVSQIKDAASGDLSAANTAIDGANRSMKTAFDEVGGALDSVGGGSGKPAHNLGSLKAALQPLQDGDLQAVTTVSRDCDLGGTVSREIDVDISRSRGNGVIKVTTTANDCKFEIRDGKTLAGPRITSIEVEYADTDTAVVTLNGNRFGAPDTDSTADDDAYAVVAVAENADPEDGIEYVPSQSVIHAWTDSKIQLSIDETVLVGKSVEFVVYADDEGSNVATVDLSSNGETNFDKSGLAVAQDDQSPLLTVRVNGSQTISLDTDLEFEGNEPQPTAINEISLTAESWESEVKDEAIVVSLLQYTDFSMSGAADGNSLVVTLDGSLLAQENEISFSAQYKKLELALAQDGLVGALNGGDGGSDSEDPALETTINGGIALDISAAEQQCVASEYEFETIEALMTLPDAPCPDAGILVVTEVLEEGNVSVQYTFTGNGNVQFSGSDDTLEVPCSALGGAASACLFGERDTQ